MNIDDQSAAKEGGQEYEAFLNYQNNERVSRAPFGMFDDEDLDEQ